MLQSSQVKNACNLKFCLRTLTKNFRAEAEKAKHLDKVLDLEIKNILKLVMYLADW